MDNKRHTGSMKLVDLTDVSVENATASAEASKEGSPIHLEFTREDERWWMQVFD